MPLFFIRPTSFGHEKLNPINRSQSNSSPDEDRLTDEELLAIKKALQFEGPQVKEALRIAAKQLRRTSITDFTGELQGGSEQKTLHVYGAILKFQVFGK